MTSNVADLIVAQRELGGRISRFLPNVRKTSRDGTTVALLSRRQRLLEEYWKEFSDRHKEIVPKAEPDNEYLSTDYFSEIEEAYLSQGAILDDWIQSLTPSAADCQASETRVLVGSEPALPQINLPTFSGDLFHWESFRDQFNSLVHDSSRLPKVRKLQYLKSCLTGEAAKMLHLTPITDSHYDGAWAALERRFGNIRLLSSAHMRRLISSPSATKQHPSEIKRLLDEFRQALEAFRALKKPITEWDEWFVFLLVEKLDHTTRMAWEVSLTDPTEIPSFDALESFLENRVHALSSARSAEPSPTPKSSSPLARGGPPALPRATMTVNVGESSKKPRSGRHCPLCAGNHALGSCTKFKAMTSLGRRDFVQKTGLCLSCLGIGHSAQSCPSNFRCWVCNAKHHTALHEACFAATVNETPGVVASTSAASYTVSATKTSLLATARISLESPAGDVLCVRALLDSGSECSFVSEWAAQRLRLPRRPVHVSLTGYQGTKVGTARAEVQVTLRSPVDPELRIPLEALVTKTLTAPTPSHPLPSEKWPHINDLPLADPSYGVPARVDALLGADVCGYLFQDQRVGPPGTPAAVRTPFGWTLLGPVQGGQASSTTTRLLHIHREEPVPDLQRFWELEEVPRSAPMTPDELKCERLFQETTSRNSSGRYVVRLPFKETDMKVGTSRRTALRMLLAAESRRERDPNLRRHYVNFMDEYRRLGHMQPVSDALGEQDEGFYLPHHAVWREVNGSGKIRVVFNASCVADRRRSLNDVLLTGPRLQADLWAIVTRWRLFRVAFSTDIVKMFRQIEVHPDDRNWLRILWRTEPADTVTEFQLTTVTYGTASAPYLAHRVLNQLATDEAVHYPLAATLLRRHAYVDDILGGADSRSEAMEARRQLTAMLNSAGFPLDKWASSDPTLRSSVDDVKVIQDQDVHGALGLVWQTGADILSVRGPRLGENVPAKWTKRTILSEIARLFDPLGWLSPVLIQAKVLLQDLWLAGVSWDDPVDTTLAARWSSFRLELPALASISVPRWVNFTPSTPECELHGFCDASERAYAACTYLVVRRPDGCASNLLLAKTRVAPLKQICIPRLELCGAVLLARLLSSLQKELELTDAKMYAWSDSTVVLAWLQSHASRWKPFVAHRVAEVHTLLPGASWRHVPTQDNPADLATRGLGSEDLRLAERWWNGPTWVSREPGHWPAQPTIGSIERPPEERRATVLAINQPSDESTYIDNFSSLGRLTRVTAYVRRFVANCRRSAPASTGVLSSAELWAALGSVVRTSQRQHFGQELEALKRGKPLSPNSALKSLNPFLDPEGTIRVGGRLRNANLNEARRHPAALHRASHVATLVIRDAHIKTLHGGALATASWVHRAFWIPRGRSRIKQVVRHCVICARFRAATGQQQMGDLPASRVLPAKPFLRSGVDYAGPVAIRTAKGRGHPSQKGYLVVFVCMVTKAVHLDAVTDLTSTAFVAAFHRFTARRGRCCQLYSDNSTTFRGAHDVLQQMFRASSRFYRETAETLSNEGTDWTFIPPYSPHLGGLWEAAIKSTKNHMRRVIGETTLTYEEMATLLCRIEACLNSRPLTPLPEDPGDPSPLTPGHFLIGECIRAPPEPLDTDTSTSPVSRWKMISNMLTHFWRRWSQEYIHQLQQRNKWQDRRENIQPGALVLVKDDLTPPTRWPLARVESVRPGPDGLVRIATIKMGSRTSDRTIAKLVPLPIRVPAAAGTPPHQDHTVTAGGEASRGVTP